MEQRYCRADLVETASDLTGPATLLSRRLSEAFVVWSLSLFLWYIGVLVVNSYESDHTGTSTKAIEKRAPL